MMMVYEIFNENELIMNCKYFRQQIPFSVSPTLLFLQLAEQNFHLLLRIEPDLCEVVTGSGPADQLAFQGAIWHIVTD